jgi:hypothetical protein
MQQWIRTRGWMVCDKASWKIRAEAAGLKKKKSSRLKNHE